MAAKSFNSLKLNDLFKGTNIDHTGLTIDDKNLLDYKEGSIIYEPGVEAEYVYLIIQGEVKIKFKEIKKLQHHYMNDFFGEFEVLNHSQRTSTCVANSDCWLYKIEKDSFISLVENNEQIKANLERHPEISRRALESDAVPFVVEAKVDIEKEPEKIDIALKDEPEKTPAQEIDLDSIEIKRNYDEELDLNPIIDDPLKKNDNELLKQALIDDPDDLENWSITEIKQEELPVENVPPPNEPEEIPQKKVLDNSDFDEPQKFVIPSQQIVEDPQFEEITDLQIAPSASLKETCINVLNYFLKNTSSTSGAIYLYNPDTDLFDLYHQTNPISKSLSFRYHEGISGIVSSQKQMQLVNDAKNDLRFIDQIDQPNGFKGLSVLYVPLLDRESFSVGLVQLGFDKSVLTPDEEKRILNIANEAAKTIQKSVEMKGSFELNSFSLLNSLSKFFIQDIQTPMLTIRHYASIISRFDIQDEVRKVINLISMQANSVIDLIQATSDYSDRKISVKSEGVSFNESLGSILNLLSEFVESRNIKLFKKFDDDVKVKIDPRRFYVACYQIAKFSCQSMPNGGKMYFSSENDDDKVLLTIKDEGKEIPSSELVHIFEAFGKQEDEGRVTLGLAIARQIIEALNGHLSVQSSPDGTTFTISLPVSSE